jgi:hypothetical protein
MMLGQVSVLAMRGKLAEAGKLVDAAVEASHLSASPVAVLVSMERPASSASAWVIHDKAEGAIYGKEPAMPSIHHPEIVWHGWDVHKDTISVAVLHPGQQIPAIDKISHDEASVRRLIDRAGDRRLLRICYKAGPTGYELAQLLAGMGVHCEVIAPSLIPTTPVIGPRPTSEIAAGWCVCTALVS